MESIMVNPNSQSETFACKNHISYNYLQYCMSLQHSNNYVHFAGVIENE